MGIVNHISGIDRYTLFHAVAYGRHLVTGHLTKSNVSGSSGSHIITLQQMLGRGPWDGCEGLWWNGLEIKSDKYRFYSGGQTPNPTELTYTADAGTDVFTSTAHGLSNGAQIFLMPPSSGGSLPGNAALGVMYFLRDVTTDTFKLATTLGGTAINISSNGSGTLKFRTTSIDRTFPKDTPHSGVAHIVAELDSGLGEFDTESTPPEGLAGIFRTTKCQDYEDDGDPDGSPVYSANPALQVADLIIRHGGKAADSIDWPAWCDWRDFCDELIEYDYTELDLDGFGLTASYYNGTAFDTLVTKRIDPWVEFVLSSGSPGVGVNVDNFSAKFEGSIKPKFTETYTFYITHTHGVKVFVDNLSTPLIDEWSSTGTHSATIALTADTFYDIRVEWKHTTGDAELRLEWSAPSEAREVIPPQVLYPKTENRPRYETHPFFAGPTRLDDAVITILNLCNSTYQMVDGKYVFFCLEQLESSQFRLRNADIVDGSISVRPREVQSLRNVWQAAYRDIDSQYMDLPIAPVTIERPDLIEAAGRRIDGDTIEMFNTTRHQAYRVLKGLVERAVDSKYEISLTGMPTAFGILPGDVGGVDVDFLGWTNKKCLVVSATDSSSESTADERPLILREWTGQTLTEPDLEDPTVPADLAATVISDSEIDWTWSAATDDVGVTGYEISLDGGSAVDVGNVLGYNGTSLTSSTLYGLRVRSYDAAGNRSDWSGEVSATTEAAPIATDSDALAFLTAASITDLTIAGAVDDLVIALKAGGIWAKCIAIYPFVGGTASTHKYNLKDPRDLDAAFRLTFHGGLTHSATGCLPNGSTGYADTHIAPSAEMADDDVHWSFYSRTDINNGANMDLGCVSVAAWQLIIRTNLLGGSHLLQDGFTGGGGSRMTPAVTDSLGLATHTVTNSATSKVFKRGTELASTTPAGNITDNTNSILIFAQVPSGSFGQRECAFMSCGSGLTDTEVGDLYTAVQAFQTALSRNV